MEPFKVVTLVAFSQLVMIAPVFSQSSNTKPKEDVVKEKMPIVKAVKKDSLIGLWCMEEFIENGKRPAPKDLVLTSRLMLTKDSYFGYTVDKNETYVDDLFVQKTDGYEVDDTKAPAHFNEYYIKDDKRIMNPYIVEFQDDKLVFATRDKDKGRPESFSEKDLNIRVYSRMKKL